MKLVFENICAAYRKKTVLEDVSFTVESGSITVLIGRNGAGKSTLLRCLMGEKRDHGGRILLDGQDVRSLAMPQLAHMAACLPQDLPRPHVTVRELVSFGRTPYTPLTGKLTAGDREIVDRTLHAVGMEAYGNAFVDTLSGGECKKAFFAMTLAQDTPLVVLDEPTAHLDAASRFGFLELVDRMRRQTAKTFLLVMHELPEVLRCADRIAVLHGHRLVFTGSPEECLASQIPQTCFGIRISGSREDGYAAVPLK